MTFSNPKSIKRTVLGKNNLTFLLSFQILFALTPVRCCHSYEELVVLTKNYQPFRTVIFNFQNFQTPKSAHGHSQTTETKSAIWRKFQTRYQPMDLPDIKGIKCSPQGFHHRVIKAKATELVVSQQIFI